MNILASPKFIKIKKIRNNTVISMIKDYYPYYVKKKPQIRKNAKIPKEKYTEIKRKKDTNGKQKY